MNTGLLLVDQDQRGAASLARLLRSDGCDVALNMTENVIAPSVIVTDLANAGSDPASLLAVVRRDWPARVVFLVTARPRIALGAVRALPDGSRVFVKPVTYVSLLDAVRKTMR